MNHLTTSSYPSWFWYLCHQHQFSTPFSFLSLKTLSSLTSDIADTSASLLTSFILFPMSVPVSLLSPSSFQLTFSWVLQPLPQSLLHMHARQMFLNTAFILPLPAPIRRLNSFARFLKPFMVWLPSADPTAFSIFLYMYFLFFSGSLNVPEIHKAHLCSDTLFILSQSRLLFFLLLA